MPIYPYTFTPPDRDKDAVNETIRIIKNQLIMEFKSNCPKGILESFKNDDEIWEYIVENSKIKIQDSQISELLDDIMEEENENK